MAVRKVIEIGHKMLKLENKSVADLHSPLIKQLIRDLADTMKATDLIGIAAPQIGRNYQVFLTQPRKTMARNVGKTDILRVYINPRITFQSEETNLIYEGCGCVPDHGIFAPVIRPKEIEIEAYDENGEQFSLRCDGILARVIQHEYDHLQGIEFLERVTENRKIISWTFYRKDIRNSKEQKAASLITKIEYKKITSPQPGKTVLVA